MDMILYPHARLGDIVAHISEVGEKFSKHGDWRCVGCDGRMVAHIGKIKAPHFQHFRGACESPEHEYTKEWIASQNPYWYRCPHCTSWMRIDHDEARTEYAYNGRKLDVAFLSWGRVVFGVEVYKTHAVDEDKARDLGRLKWIEVEAVEDLRDPDPKVRETSACHCHWARTLPSVADCVRERQEMEFCVQATENKKRQLVGQLAERLQDLFEVEVSNHDGDEWWMWEARADWNIADDFMWKVNKEITVDDLGEDFEEAGCSSIVRIQKVWHEEEWGKDYVKAEFQILKSETLPVGSWWRWRHNVSSNYYGPLRLKEFLIAVLGRDVQPEEAEAIVGRPSKLHGRIVRLEKRLKWLS